MGKESEGSITFQRETVMRDQSFVRNGTSFFKDLLLERSRVQCFSK